MIRRRVKIEPERERGGSDNFCCAASSIIAVGLDWRMAIGACVLGNTIMGLVITINGRMGATVCCVFQSTELSCFELT